MDEENKKISGFLIIAISIVIILIIFLLFFIIKFPDKPVDKKVSNFFECFDAGYTIMESYPRQCVTPSGDIFVEPSYGNQLSFENVKNKVSNPDIKFREEHLIENETLFRELFPGSSLNFVDFDNSHLIAVFLGEKPTGGYQVEITRVEEDERILKVYTTIISPGQNCIVTQALTYPFDLVMLEKTDKALITFMYANKINDC